MPLHRHKNLSNSSEKKRTLVFVKNFWHGDEIKNWAKTHVENTGFETTSQKSSDIVLT